MSGLKYTNDHEWIRAEGDSGTIGISDYAQGQLGDIVYVELPAVGATLKKGDQFAVVESVKAASEVYAPVSGTVSEVNAALADDPAKVNAAPTDDGWFVKLTLSDPGELDGLMDEAAYADFIKGLD
jgi:glycine cleavage system H protein